MTSRFSALNSEYKLSRQQHRQILALAVPMILSNISVPLLGLVDTAVIGHLSESYYLGGVAIGSMIVSLLLWLMGFLRMSTTGLVAQAHGRGDSLGCQRLLARSMWLALALGVLVLALQVPIKHLAFTLAGGSAQVQHYGQVYFDIRIWSTPAALLNLVLLGWLLGRQNARAPMILLLVTNISNILLDLWFVIGLEWGVAGAAWATVIADHCGLLVGLYLMSVQLGREPRLAWRKWLAQAQFKQLRPLLALNRDIFLRTLCLQLCFSFVTFQGARLGDDIVAANAVLMNFLMFISYGLDGFAYAVEALVGKAIGAKQRQALRQAVWGCLQWSLLTGVLFTLGFAAGGELLVQQITSLQAVQQTAYQYLPYIVAMPLVAIWCYLFDGVFIGAAEGRAMRNSMILSTFGVFFPVWLLVSFLGQQMGSQVGPQLASHNNHALWLALLLFMAARGISLGWIYYSRHAAWCDERVAHPGQ